MAGSDCAGAGDGQYGGYGLDRGLDRGKGFGSAASSERALIGCGWDGVVWLLGAVVRVLAAGWDWSATLCAVRTRRCAADI
jgi:hypothetical protein